MNVLNKILEWMQNRPLWEQDAARRLLESNSALTEADYKELYNLMKKEHEIDISPDISPIPLSKNDIPSDNQSKEKVILHSLGELTNVNRISPSQTLSFQETGMTVIYGDNGSGKSGYARVLKRACRARGQTEPILPDANATDAENLVPTAKFDISVDGVPEEILWSQDAASSSEQLSKISVFDSQCARSYLLEEQDVAYLPYGLDILENLAQKVLPALNTMLDEEIDKLNIKPQPFAQLARDTEVGKHIHSLSATSDTERIEELAKLSQKEIDRLEELKKSLHEENPASKMRDLNMSANRIKSFAKEISNQQIRVNDEAVAELKALDNDKIAAEQSELIATKKLQEKGKPLSGTGEEAWRNLFESARQYSDQLAYPSEKFPNLPKDSDCPLCQQPLLPNAIERLKVFDDYIKNDITEQANKKRKNLRDAKENIENVRFEIPNKEILKEILSFDEKILGVINNYNDGLEKRRRAMLSSLDTNDWINIPDLLENPCTRIRKIAAQQIKKSRIFSRAIDQNKRDILEKEYNELAARNDLGKFLNSIINLIEDLKKEKLLESCRRDLNPFPFSKKSREITTSVVSKDLESALNSEFQKLGVDDIKTKLKKRTVRGTVFHQIILTFPNKFDINKILSEGEQRIIAIGSFLAELELANPSCGIVFDDPVSSLDHDRRLLVAERLKQESQRRQVIIFTHDIVFAHHIYTLFENCQTKPSFFYLKNDSLHFGIVTEGLEWTHQGYQERIHNLEKSQKELEKNISSSKPDMEYELKIREQYNHLRSTIERVVEDFILNRTVKRFDDQIYVRNLPDVANLEKPEVDEIIQLYSKCHRLITAHDPPSAKNDPSPTPDNLKKDIDTLNQVIKKIKSKRSGN